MAKNHNFSRILTFWGSCTEPLLPMRVKFGVREAPRADPRSTVTRQISSECVHCVGFRWLKTTILGQFWYFWGLLYRSPFTDEDQILCAGADPRSTFTRQIPSECVHCSLSASGGQKPQFWANFDILGDSCTDPLLPM